MELAISISLLIPRVISEVIEVLYSLDFSKEKNSQYVPIIFF